MSLKTPALHAAFLRPFGVHGRLLTDPRVKPALIDLDLPHPPRLRVYLYNLVGGVGTVRDTEFKAVLRLPGQEVNEYASFDHSGGRLAVLVAYEAQLDVFVLWDASIHPEFKNGGNIQVRTSTVLEAAATGMASQRRALAKVKTTEVVIACQSWALPDAMDRRLALTGGDDA